MFILILIIVILLFLIFENLISPAWPNMPPGPRGIPFMGNLLDLLFEEPVKYYAKIADKFGPISSIRFRSRRVVLLSSSELVRRAFLLQGTAFSERPDGILLSYITGGKGIVMAKEEINSHARRVLMNSFKEFGYGKRDIQSVIDVELESYMKNLKRIEMKRYNPRYDLAVSTLNITWNMLSNQRFDPENPSVKWFIDTIGMSFELVKQGNFLNFTLVLQFFATFLRPKAFIVGWSTFTRLSMFKKTIREHHESIDNLDRKEDFMYKFLDEQRRHKKKKQLTKTFSDSQLSWILSDIFIASLETTVTMLRWALTMAVKYPQIQREIHEEIDSNLGRYSKPCLEDKEKMPLMEAFMSEALRLYPAIPLLMHSTAKDTSLAGYNIPKGTWVIVNLFAIHRDKEIWGDPEIFRPSRFLDDEGNYVKKEHLIPFSIGKRNCIGEPLAIAELFLFLTNIFQNYQVVRFDETKPWKTSIKYGLSLTPPDLDFKFIPRDELPSRF